MDKIHLSVFLSLMIPIKAVDEECCTLFLSQKKKKRKKLRKKIIQTCKNGFRKTDSNVITSMFIILSPSLVLILNSNDFLFSVLHLLTPKNAIFFFKLYVFYTGYMYEFVLKFLFLWSIEIFTMTTLDQQAYCYLAPIESTVFFLIL